MLAASGKSWQENKNSRDILEGPDRVSEKSGYSGVPIRQVHGRPQNGRLWTGRIHFDNAIQMAPKMKLHPWLWRLQSAAMEVDPLSEVLPPHPALGDYYEGSKRPFLRRIFDQGAADYDQVERMLALGSGSWYRRKALGRAGLKRGMKVLDVAVGTGLVAREEVGIVGDSRLVVGLDPSAGMLKQAKKTLDIPVILGVGEQLPFPDGHFDFLSMGYALRHLSDLNMVFREFCRVLKPGGRLCVLELIRPRGKVGSTLLKWYMRNLLPPLTRLITRRSDSQLLWKYYWDTIEFCIPPQRVVEAMEEAGFIGVGQHVELGIFSEYNSVKPIEPGGGSDDGTTPSRF